MKKIKNHKFIHANCLEAMQDFPDKSIDLIIADLPYGKTACEWDSIISFNPMWKELKRIRKNKAAILLFGIEPFSSYLRISNIKEYKHDWIWLKNTGTNFFHCKRMPIRYTENIHVFHKKSSWYYPQKTTGHKPTNNGKGRNTGNIYSGKLQVDYVGGQTDRYPKNVIEFKTTNNYLRIHPTEKPVSLMEYFILTYSKKGQVVLDFTCGSGSTGVAAAKHERMFIGIDNGICKNKKSIYCGVKWVDVAKHRIELIDKIICPECEHIFMAEIIAGTPWDIYIADCPKCKYKITESEWEKIK